MAGWTPARPERDSAAWRAPGAAGPGLPTPPTERPPGAQGQGAARLGRRRQRRRLPRSPARRVLIGAAALVLGIAVVAGVGTVLTPDYGDLGSYGTTPVADLRTRPSAVGWSTDLSREILPGVPVRCAAFSSSDATDRYVVVTANSPSLGATSRCSQTTAAQVESTVAMLDTDTGRILWARDLSRSFPSRSGSVSVGSETVVRGAKRVVVQLTVDGRSAIASLSSVTGDVMSSTTLDSGETSSQPTVQGSLVLYGGSVAREGSTRWTLADARRVDQPLWSAVLDDARPPVLTAGAAFARIDGRSARIDGTTGRVTRLGDGSVDLTSVLSDENGILTTDAEPSGIVVSAWNDEGRRLWSRGGIGALSGITRDCVMVALPGTSKGTCVDRATGRSRWTTDIGTGAFTYAIPGQTSNDVMVYRNKGTETELDVYDGDTGRLRYPIVLPPVSFVALASRTTGYLQVNSDSGSPTGITAFDTASGRQLWTIEEAGTRDTAFWGGQLVRVSQSGVATQLTNRSRRVLGE